MFYIGRYFCLFLVFHKGKAKFPGINAARALCVHELVCVGVCVVEHEPRVCCRAAVGRCTVLEVACHYGASVPIIVP